MVVMMENLEDGEVGGGELGVYMTEMHCILHESLKLSKNK